MRKLLKLFSHTLSSGISSFIRYAKHPVFEGSLHLVIWGSVLYMSCRTIYHYYTLESFRPIISIEQENVYRKEVERNKRFKEHIHNIPLNDRTRKEELSEKEYYRAEQHSERLNTIDSSEELEKEIERLDSLIEKENRQLGGHAYLPNGKGQVHVSLFKQIKDQQKRIAQLEKRLQQTSISKDESVRSNTSDESNQNAFINRHPLHRFIYSHQKQLKEHLQNLFQVSIAFSSPQTMYLNQTQPVELLLEPRANTQQAERQLRKIVEDRRQTDDLPQKFGADSIITTDIVEARLTGAGFGIDAVNHETQLINKETSTRWTWEVTPEEEDARRLHLSISTKVKLGEDSEFFELQTYERDIDVKVSLMNRFSLLLEKYQGVLPFIFGTASLISIYGWMRKWLGERKLRSSSSDTPSKSPAQSTGELAQLVKRPRPRKPNLPQKPPPQAEK